MRIFINVRNSIRKILREEIEKNPDYSILNKMIVFNSQTTKEDIKKVLNIFKDFGVPTPGMDREWIDDDVDVVMQDYIKRGRELALIPSNDKNEFNGNGTIIYWGNPADFMNHDVTRISYGDFISSIYGFDVNDAFDKLYESEEDNLDWAKQSIQSEITLKSIWKYLEIGDQITLSGDISNDEDEILLILNNEPFEVEKRYDDGFYFSWLKNPEERLGGWQAINISTKNKDVVEVNIHKFPTDGDLIVNSFNKTDYPF